MEQGGNCDFIRQKRSDHLTIQMERASVKIRDQKPLHTGNITLEGNWSFGDVIESLNQRVFFWPGWHDRPISYGERHFVRYAGEEPVIIRVSTADIFTSNTDNGPLFCRFNSGSPRCSKGVGSPRGPNTFLPCYQADFTPSKVVEVTFVEKVNLPERIEIAHSVTGPWQRL